ncbi:MAG: hypothetical protein H6833_06190 [Planctomycetes bacterium]|nr:hypothetical protein [Planctomycetota bacterium]
MTRTPRRLALALLIGVAPTPLPAQVTTPVVFDGSYHLRADADPRFDLTQGTIEFYVALRWDDGGLDYPPCVVASAKGPDQARYAVFFDEDKQGIALWNGLRWAERAFEFEGGRYYHVALVTRDERTAVVIDGECIGSMAIGYGRLEGGALFVGSSGEVAVKHPSGRFELAPLHAFEGSIVNLRIWNEPLSLEDIRAVSEVAGLVSEQRLASSLVVFSNFTASESTLRIARRSPSAIVDVRRQAKLARPFAQAVPWLTDYEQAREQAEHAGKLLAVYRSPTTVVHRGCDLFESGFLAGEEWRAAAGDLVCCLLLGAEAVDPRIDIVHPTRDTTLARYWPWSDESIAACVVRARSCARSLGATGLDRAAALVAGLECEWLDAEGEKELATLSAGRLEDLVRERYERASFLHEMRTLLAQYHRDLSKERSLVPVAGATGLGTLEVERRWRENAYRHDQKTVTCPGAGLREAEYSLLVARGALDVFDTETARSMLEQVARMAPYDAVLGLELAALMGELREAESDVFDFEDDPPESTPAGFVGSAPSGDATPWHVKEDERAFEGRRVLSASLGDDDVVITELLLAGEPEASSRAMAAADPDEAAADLSPTCLEADVRVRAGAGMRWVGIRFRVGDEGGGYSACWEPAKERLTVYRWIGAQRVLLKAEPMAAVDLSVWHHLSVHADGSHIGVEFDGLERLACEDSQFLAGDRMGLAVGGTGAVSFDVLRVRAY